MTPGQLALAEAARLEAARVYGSVHAEHKQPVGIAATVAEAEVSAKRPRAVIRDRTRDPEYMAANAALAGAGSSELMDRFGLSYAQARAVRLRVVGAA